MAIINEWIVKKLTTAKENINLFFSLFFGLIHELGLSNYFKMMVKREVILK